MKVQEYLRTNGILKLQEEFKIDVRDYEDRVVLNYNQYESPKFNPIVDECRALILRKNTWEVLARSFDRFYNVGEDSNHKNFPINQARIEEKLDGSIILLYNDSEKWNISTRSMAYAEGQTNIGLTFNQLITTAMNKTSIMSVLNEVSDYKNITWIFEFTSPETRVVTPYKDTNLTLIGARNNSSGKELYGTELDHIAQIMNVPRPKSYRFQNIEEALKFLDTLEMTDEGFVMTFENTVLCKDFWRMKCKNKKYLEIAHMRQNGGLSAKRILALIVKNDYDEYLSYFPEHKPYFDFVKKIWDDMLFNINTLYQCYEKIESQKDFAIAIISNVKNSWEKGILFDMRKRKISISEVVKNMDTNACYRLAVNLDLRNRLSKAFSIKIEDDKEDDQ